MQSMIWKLLLKGKMERLEVLAIFLFFFLKTLAFCACVRFYEKCSKELNQFILFMFFLINHYIHINLFCYIAETVRSIVKQYYDRINKLEDAKYDLEFVVKRKDLEVRHNAKNYTATLFCLQFFLKQSPRALLVKRSVAQNLKL